MRDEAAEQRRYAPHRSSISPYFVGSSPLGAPFRQRSARVRKSRYGGTRGGYIDGRRVPGSFPATCGIRTGTPHGTRPASATAAATSCPPMLWPSAIGSVSIMARNERRVAERARPLFAVGSTEVRVRLGVPVLLAGQHRHAQ